MPILTFFLDREASPDEHKNRALTLSLQVQNLMQQNRQIMRELEELPRQESLMDGERKNKKRQLYLNLRKAMELRAEAEEEKKRWLRRCHGELSKLSLKYSA